MGIKALMESAELYGEEEEYKPSRFESWISQKTGKKPEDIMVFFALLTALGFAVLLFMVLPALLTGFLGGIIKSGLIKSLIEGLIRLTTFIIYIVVISRMKEIKRVFEYHGAEHKVIHCYEHEEELTVENARKYTTLHPRCGTAFLLIVMVISILAFSFLEWDNIILRVAIKVLLLPFVAGVSYEIIKWAGASNSGLVNIVMYPGLMLQKLTTKEPDDEQLEVAICSFLAAMGTSRDRRKVLDLNVIKAMREAQEQLNKAGIASPQLEAGMLMGHLLNCPRERLYMDRDRVLTPEDTLAYFSLVDKRVSGVPIHYIIGHREFMGLDFYVEEGVLIPRPDTEVLVEHIIEHIKDRGIRTPRIIDLGTGSGAIAISLAKYIEDSLVTAVDIDSCALRVTQKNALAHGLEDRIDLIR